MKSNAELVPVTEVTRDQRDQMFALMDRHYENVTREAFHADLAEKHWVILLFDSVTGAVCGFSTQVVLNITVDGEPRRALFSGDTVVEREHRGDSALAHVWGWLALTLADEPGPELYWFLISKGYKTYRFLPVFFREFYPRHDAPTPPAARRLLDALALARFGAAYDAAAGILRGGPGKDRLRPGVADVTPERLRDPHVAFFARANPGHAAGDELCCLAPVRSANFTQAARRVLGAAPALQEAVA